MGVEAALIATTAVSVAAEGYSMYNQAQGAAMAQQSLNLQAKQNELAYAQKSLDTVTQLNNYLDVATAQSTTRGVGLGSASLGSGLLSGHNRAASEQKNLDVEKSIFETNIETERRNIRNRLAGSLLGSVGKIAGSGFSLAYAWPRRKS